MTMGETRMMEIVTSSLPRIARELEKMNKIKALEMRLRCHELAAKGILTDESMNREMTELRAILDK